MSTALVAYAQHEERYIYDWVEYHLHLGFDHIYIGDANEEKYEYPLSDILKDFDSKRLTIYEYRKNQTPLFIYNDMLSLIRKDAKYDWYSILDIDEYLILRMFDNDLSYFLSTIPSSAEVIKLIIKQFTDGGQLNYQPYPVMERFTEMVPVNNNTNFTVKSMFTETALDKYKTINDVSDVFHQMNANEVDAAGHTISCMHCIPYTAAQALKIYKYACINKYKYKTAEEWAYKISRQIGLTKAIPKWRNFYVYNVRTDNKDKIILNTISKLVK